MEPKHFLFTSAILYGLGKELVVTTTKIRIFHFYNRPNKECLLATFKSLIRPILDYAAPIVYPLYSAASFRHLQLVQNRGLRLVLGCHAAAATDHLHAETQLLPAEQHLRLLATQYLARALQEHHPSHEHAIRER